ncbi:uncharacterized protein BX664DRAFT_294617 [Halteromyces radiatus]|uniref:uncharacterized protein n=1 Tax=Halteromyces radiatus TaxID=101107 RepID=UPI00221E3D03|nr:uncharacterized protein BX664DRAFT_294617 [Halteromyces radiatus]KAI8093103.1 hypothetical protein BX664DRAFT_294617 [Halteromyces radiatus]
MTQQISLYNNGFNYGEEISTIFVVGFPEDMQEREFQNMFIFSPGFEAATLKIPSKDGEEDSTVSALGNNPHTKKQIIGFAKFRSRMEALEAKDTISGRKVDAEKGSVLKAEMAKKNLHTKRGLSSNEPFQLSQHSALLASQEQSLHPSSLLQQIHPSQQQEQQSSSFTSKRFTGPHPSSVYEAFHSVPATDLTSTSADMYSDLFIPIKTTSASSNNTTRLPNTFNSSHRFSTNSIFDLSQTTDNKSSTGSFFNVGSSILYEQVEPSLASQVTPSSSNNETNTKTTTTTTSSSSSSSSTLIKTQASQHQHLHFSSSPPSLIDNNNNNNRFKEEDQQLGRAFSGLTINTTHLNSTTNNTSLASTPSTIVSNGGLPSPGILSPNGYRSFASMMMMMPSTNPADQNPPCNTLYVGNLPPNTDEDELRQLFSKCVGYKRLSFRQKANGPMCFVEFDDVYCASQALQDLYGNPLSNSVKGGIRLSFSKNPLGVRQNSISNTGCNTNNGLFQHNIPYYRDSLSFDPSFS